MAILPADCSPAACAAQLAHKLVSLRELFREFAAPEPEVHASPPVHYRQRAEFRIWHEGDSVHYRMFDGREPLHVATFPPGARRINELMTALRSELERSSVLRRRLYQVEFLTTLSGEALLTLVYHRPLDAQWEETARAAQQRLGAHIIGRSRGKRIVLDQDFVTERLEVAGRHLEYRQPEGCFVQPNAEVNRGMLAWAARASVDAADRDLLELYCGIGNFTVALAPAYRRVLATEIDAKAIRAAQYNLAANGVTNTFVARLSGAEAASALARERPFRRLAAFDLESFAPGTLLVDPPRAGLDARTLAFAASFARIIYVSCNPLTLAANLRALGGDYRIERCALFDQFPYTPHMECGVLLNRIR